MDKRNIFITAALLLTTFFSGLAQKMDNNRYPHNLELRTNLLYDVIFTPTIGMEWHADQVWGIKVDVSYSHWGDKHGMVHNIWLVNPELRYYLGNAERFYTGFCANLGKYNIYKGVIGSLFFTDETGYQGSLYSGGICIGYKLALSSTFSLDFNVGLGYTHFMYDSFTVTDRVRMYKEIKEKNVTKNLWGPTQANISLVWKFGDKR
jgi:hypothetical protein